MTDNAPVRDGTTTPPHIDSKRRKKLQQKKNALGHAEDDHEEMRMDTIMATARTDVKSARRKRFRCRILYQSAVSSSMSTTKPSGWNGYSSKGTARTLK